MDPIRPPPVMMPNNITLPSLRVPYSAPPPFRTPYKKAIQELLVIPHVPRKKPKINIKPTHAISGAQFREQLELKARLQEEERLRKEEAKMERERKKKERDEERLRKDEAKLRKKADREKAKKRKEKRVMKKIVVVRQSDSEEEPANIIYADSDDDVEMNACFRCEGEKLADEGWIFCMRCIRVYHKACVTIESDCEDVEYELKHYECDFC